MSRLFLATEASLNRQVVIKLLPPELASEVSSARFRREIEVSAQLQHPHVLPVLAAGARDDLLYYIMPYVAGESLRRHLGVRGRLEVAEAVRILAEVADALAYAHRSGIVHRDIKPENILLEEGHAVLADFGVARALAAARSDDHLTQTGTSVGTPSYMSPEQVAGESNIDARADVYALATIGYELLAGRLPFTGASTSAVLAARLTTDAEPLQALRPDVPANVARVIMHALARSPDERVQSAAAFREALLAAPVRAPGGAHGRLPWAIAAGVLLVMAAGGALFWSRVQRRTTLDENLVAVAPFDALGGNLSLWREGMVDMLSRNLDGAGPLRTVAPTTVIRRWEGRADKVSAAALGRSTGARLVVFGSVVASGRDSVRLSASLLDVGSDRVLSEVERFGAADHLDRLADSLTFELLRDLGKSRPMGATRLSSFGTRSLPALKAFLQGEQFYRRSTWDSASTEYDRALTFDTAFALALRRRGQTLGWTETGTDSLSRAFNRRAGRFNRGLAPRDSMLVLADALSAEVFGYDRDPSFAAHRLQLFSTVQELTRRYPQDPEAWHELGEARYHFGMASFTAEEKLDAFDRSLALDSAFTPAYIHPVEIALALGDTARARRYINRYLALVPRDIEAQGMGAAKVILESRPDDPAVQTLLDTSSADALYMAASALRYLRDSAEIVIRIRRSLVHHRRATSVIVTDSNRTRRSLVRALELRGRFHEARAIARPGSWEDGELALIGAVPADSAEQLFRRFRREARPGMYLSVAWWADRGDTAAILDAMAFADSVQRVTRNAAERRDQAFFVASSQVKLSLARRDTAGALRRLEAIPDTMCAFCVEEVHLRARLLAAVGRDREALALYDRLWEGWQPWRVLAQFERGRVAERLGEREKATDAYAYVADAWMHADPPLQPVVAESRAGLQRLRSDAPRGVEVGAPPRR